MTVIKAPFPWFGGKSRAAPLVWQALGDVKNYVEPFAGSLAVLLGRPHAPHVETVNDLDCYLANFWRAVQADPEAVARRADAPVNEADLSARHQWLVDQAGFRESMKTDPDFFDAKIAGWWAWGLCSWIGSGWCDAKKYRGEGDDGVTRPKRQLPHLGNAQGVNRQLPHLGNAGRGVNRKLPHLGPSRGTHRQTVVLSEWMLALSDRLRRVRIACGDWKRVLSGSVLTYGRPCGIFLDPPYTDGKMSYAVGGGVSAEVREWAIANGDRPELRIVLCGYEGEHAMPDTWRVVEWKACVGYGKTAAALANAHRERLWLSPACLDVGDQMPLEKCS